MRELKDIKTSSFKPSYLLESLYQNFNFRESYTLNLGRFSREELIEDEGFPIYCPFYDKEAGDFKHFHFYDFFHFVRNFGYELVKSYNNKNYMMNIFKNDYEKLYVFTHPSTFVLNLVVEDDEYGEVNVELTINGFSSLAFYKSSRGKIRHLKLEKINAFFMKELAKEEVLHYLRSLIKGIVEQSEKAMR